MDARRRSEELPCAIFVAAACGPKIADVFGTPDETLQCREGNPDFAGMQGYVSNVYAHGSKLYGRSAFKEPKGW